MLIKCLRGDAINLNYVIHIKIVAATDGYEGYTLDAELQNGSVFILAEDKDLAALQRFLDDLICNVNILGHKP